MRDIIPMQTPLVAEFVGHRLGRELRRIDEFLHALGAEHIAAVHQDLTANLKHPGRGRRGLSADTVLRVLIVKQFMRVPYEWLAFHLADSQSLRAFTRLELGQEPSATALQRAVKLVTAETLEATNRALLLAAVDAGVEDAELIRVDCTVTETNIHAPTDSSLLDDSIRVLTRLMSKGQGLCSRVTFTNHLVRSKRRVIGIQNARRKAKRLPLYKDLVRVAKRVVKQAEAASRRLAALDDPQANALSGQLDHTICLAKRVIDQTVRRVVRGERVPAQSKVISIFEEHTDIIIKDHRQTLYGHKLCLAGGASGLVTDLVIETGNPADSTLTVRTADRHAEIFGKVPSQMALDGGFTSRANLEALKAMGVSDVCFSKGRGLTVEEMVKDRQTFRRLRNFRSGIEMVISYLKRGFSMRRCTWKGRASFEAYAWASVLCANLVTLARIPGP